MLEAEDSCPHDIHDTLDYDEILETRENGDDNQSQEENIFLILYHDAETLLAPSSHWPGLLRCCRQSVTGGLERQVPPALPHCRRPACRDASAQLI